MVLSSSYIREAAQASRRQVVNMVRVSSLAGGLALLMLFGVSCGGSGSNKGGPNDGEQAPLPATRLDLPTPPRLGDEPVPTAWPDGSLSVYGLMRNDEKHLDSKVIVTGVVDQVYECPEGTEPCDEPHFFITDGVDHLDYRLMVVSTYKEDDEFHKGVEPGAKFQISGVFSRQSMHGFLNSRGLLDAEELTLVKTDDKK